MRFIRFEILAILFLFNCYESVFSQITIADYDFDTIVTYPTLHHYPRENGKQTEDLFLKYRMDKLQ